MEAQDILIKLAEMTPVIGVLVWVVIYFKKEVEQKNNEIKELNALLREQQKETLTVINKLTEVVQDLKEFLKDKLK